MQKYEEETKETCQNGKKSVKTEKCLSKREKILNSFRFPHSLSLRRIHLTRGRRSSASDNR